MTALRQQMTDDMILRGLSKATQEAYLRAVAGFANYFQHRPDELSQEDAQRYLLHLIEERGLAAGTCNTVVHGLRFLYRVTLGRGDTVFRLPCARQPKRLPEILDQEEVARLFRVTANRKHRALLKTTYAAGLRVSETVSLRVGDIDSARMSLRIEQGKRRKDRYALLSNNLLKELREYWHAERPAYWLFPNQDGSAPLNRSTAYRIFKQAKEKAGITKAGGIHSPSSRVRHP